MGFRGPNWLAKIVRLEALLALAVVALIAQLVPQTGGFVSGVVAETAGRILSLFDVRQWPRSAWLSLNVVFVLALIGVRFRSDVGRAVRRVAWALRLRRAPRERNQTNEDYEMRRARDEEWRERAKNRLPHT